VATPIFLALDAVLSLDADQIERYGGRRGVRDMTLLESALGMRKRARRKVPPRNAGRATRSRLISCSGSRPAR